MPAWLRGLGLRAMPLGLDLRGGIYLVYEVDVDGAVTQVLARYERDARTALREKDLPYLSVESINEGTGEAARRGVTVVLRDAGSLPEGRKAVQAMDPDLVWVDAMVTPAAGGAPEATLTALLTPAQIKARQDFAIQQNITSLNNRVNSLGVSEAVVQRQGQSRIAVQLPGVQDASEVIRILGKVATLEFRLGDTINSPIEAKRSGRAPVGTKLYNDRSGQPVLLKRELILTGDQLADASSSMQNGEPAVSVKLDSRGGEEMLRTTRENLGKPMAVVFIERERVLEDQGGQKVAVDRVKEEVISLATIRGVFSNQFEITGISLQEGQELAKLLRAGALAAPIFIVEQKLVGPSLGQDNIDRGVRALIIGLGVVFVFVAFYYRGFGLVGCAVLLANVVLLAALLTLTRAALSLPGIAGMVLTVGMAVDANILIYERIREELRLGMSPRAAINAGFDGAFSSIFDGNITTLIAGVVLFVFGSGPVKGFAVVLCLGIVTSMFTALTGSRALIELVWGRRKHLTSLSI
jgi:preprotein translocase subunit SecD